MNHKLHPAVRFGIIGTNTITDKVIQAGREDDRFILSALTSRNRERAKEFALKHRVEHIFDTPLQMASSEVIDAVYIATPNICHAEQSIMFMEQGKHVLCEKPIASNARELKTMIDAAKANSVVLMEAMKPTLTPNFNAIRSAVGKVGKLRRYFSSYCQYSSRYDSFKEGVVLNAFKRELSNGALMDIGVYTIYPMVVLFGRPQSIKAQGSLLSTGVDAQGSVMFNYGDMEASVVYSKVADSFLPSEIQGEDGTILIDRMNVIGDVKLQMRGGSIQAISSPDIHNEYYYEVAEFIDLIIKGKRESETNSLENSLITMEIMDEIRHQLGVHYPADEIISTTCLLPPKA